MILNCGSCGQSFDYTLTSAGPGDIVGCPHCAMPIMLTPGGQTVGYSKPVPGLDSRPESLKDEEVLPAGTLIGSYRVDKFIGRGGMGSVYLAQHVNLNRAVALKILPQKYAADSEFVGRFKREANALAALSHPNIVSVHDMGTQGQIHFLAMEYVEGLNLRDVIHAGKLTPDQALKIVPQLCEALEYAHSRGVIHRDIKPENILMDRAGVPKIADFGLAKIVKGDAISAPLTQTNVIMGTVEYMAPEQRDSTKGVDHRADIYSMGVVLYEMLTGELPIGRFAPASKRVQVDVRIDDVVLKALDADPGLRYQRASHLGTDISKIGEQSFNLGTVAIIDSHGGNQLGMAPGRRLRIKGSKGQVAVATWNRAEIGLPAPSTYRLSFEADAAVVEIEDPWKWQTITIPRDLSLEIAVEKGEITLSGVRGQTRISTEKASVKVVQYEGRLSIQSEKGLVKVEGIKTAAFEVRTRSGSVAIGGLELTQGEATIDTQNGEITLSVAPTSSLRYQVFTGSVIMVCPPGSARAGKTATGTIGQGQGHLSVRSETGNIWFGVKEWFSGMGAGFTNLGRSMSPKLKADIGTYVITCAAIWIFFGLISRSVTVPIIITVFWGMSVATRIWKGYVEYQPPPVAPPAAPPVPATQFQVAPPSPGKGMSGGAMPVTEFAPPAPVVPSRRVSVWSYWCGLGLILPILSAAGVVIVSLILDGGLAHVLTSYTGNDAASTMWTAMQVQAGLRVALIALSFASVLTGAFMLALGTATLGHVHEFRDTLRGKAPAILAVIFGLVAIGIAWFHGVSRLEDHRHTGAEMKKVDADFRRSIAGGTLTVPEWGPKDEAGNTQVAADWKKAMDTIRYSKLVDEYRWGYDMNREHAVVCLRTLDGNIISLSLVRSGQGIWRLSGVRVVGTEV